MIEMQDPPHATHVQGHHRRVLPAQRSYSADHARATAPGHDRHRGSLALHQHGTHLLVRGGPDHSVGRPLWLSGAQRHQIGVALAGGVHDPF